MPLQLAVFLPTFILGKPTLSIIVALPPLKILAHWHGLGTKYMLFFNQRANIGLPFFSLQQKIWTIFTYSIQ